MVAVDGAGHGGPGFADDEEAAVLGCDGVAAFGDDLGEDAEEGFGGGARFGGDGARKRGDKGWRRVSVCQ